MGQARGAAIGRTNRRQPWWPAAVLVAGLAGCPGPEPVTTPTEVAEVVVTPNPATLEAGDTVRMTATAKTKNGTVVSGQSVTWSSTAAAQVDNQGLVRGVAVGAATVSAVVSGVTGSATVQVTPVALGTVVMTPHGAALGVGDDVSLAVEVRSHRGDVVTDRTVTWTSRTPAVAQVNDQGRVHGVSAGDSWVIAEAEGHRDSAFVVVAAPASQTISGGGGTVGSTSGTGHAEVVVPANAAQGSVSLTLAPVTEAVNPAVRLPGTRVDLTVTGTGTVVAPLTLTVKYPVEVVGPGGPGTIRLYVEQNGVWYPLAGSHLAGSGLVTAPLPPGLVATATAGGAGGTGRAAAVASTLKFAALGAGFPSSPTSPGGNPLQVNGAPVPVRVDFQAAVPCAPDCPILDVNPPNQARWITQSNGQVVSVQQPITTASSASAQVVGLQAGTDWVYVRATVIDDPSSNTSTRSQIASDTAIFVVQPAPVLLTIQGGGTGSGTVTAPAAGSQPALNCVITAGTAAATGCSQSYPAGTAVSLTATANAGYGFVSWSGGSCSTGNPCSVTLAQATTVTAAFGVNQLQVAVTGLPAGVSAAGTITGPSGFNQALTAQVGAPQTFTQVAPGGYTATPLPVVSGTTTYTASAVSTTVVAGQTATLTLAYAVNPTLTIQGGGTGSGTVAAPAAGGQPALSCLITTGTAATTGCSQTYPVGTVVSLTATPSAGYGFVSWSGGSCSTGNPCSVTLAQATTVTAAFGVNQLQVTVTGLPAGVSAAGTITGPNGFNQALTAQVGAPQTFTQVAPGGYTATPLPVVSGTTTYTATTVSTTVVAGQTATLTVAYTGVANPVLTIRGGGTGSGTVTAPAAGGRPALSCLITNGTAATTGCSQSYPAGTIVSLTAAPNAGYGFVSWSGGNCSTGNPCFLTLAQATTVTAAFGVNQLQVAVTGLPAGVSAAGTITGPSGFNQALTAQVGTPQTFTQVAPGGYTATPVQVVSGTTTYTASAVSTTVVAGQTATLTVAYAGAANPVLTIQGGGTGSGTVSAPAAGGRPALSCLITAGTAATTGCSQSYPAGTVVTLTATPNVGHGFVSWSGGSCSTANPCSVTLAQATTVTAAFGVNQLQVAVTGLPAGVSAAGTITGPSGFNQALTAQVGTPQTFTQVAPGGYTATPLTVVSGTTTYTATVVSTTVVAGQTATLTVAYVGVANPVLTIQGGGTGSGTVTAPTAGGRPALNCVITTGTAATTGCSQSYPARTVVPLTATANSGHGFVSWSGGSCSTGNPCSVTLAQATTVTAAFGVNQLQVAVTGLPAGVSAAGTITGPAGFSQALTAQVGTPQTFTQVAPGGYTATPLQVVNGTTTYTASAVSTTVVAGQTATLTLAYVGTSATAVTVQAITLAANGLPVILSAVGGLIDVQLNIVPGPSAVARAEVTLGGTVVAIRTFATPLTQPTTPTIRVNTAQVRQNAGIFVPVVFNGNSAIAANVYSAGAPSPLASSPTVVVTMTNPDAVIRGAVPLLVPTATTPSVVVGSNTYFTGTQTLSGYDYAAFGRTLPLAVTIGSNLCGASGDLLTAAASPTTGIALTGQYACAGAEGGNTVSASTATTYQPGAVGPDGTPLVPPTTVSSLGTTSSINGETRWDLVLPGVGANPGPLFVDNKGPLVSVGVVAFNPSFDQPWINASFAFSSVLSATDGGTGLAGGVQARLYSTSCTGTLVATGADLGETASSGPIGGFRICGIATDQIGNPGASAPSNFFGVDKTPPIARFVGSTSATPLPSGPPAFATFNTLGPIYSPTNPLPAEFFGVEGFDSRSGFHQGAALVGYPVSTSHVRTAPTGPFTNGDFNCPVASSSLSTPLSDGFFRSALQPTTTTCGTLVGYYIWNATVIDRAGNASSSIFASLGFDPNPPHLSNVGLTSAPFAAGQSATLAITADDDLQLISGQVTLAFGGFPNTIMWPFFSMGSFSDRWEVLPFLKHILSGDQLVVPIWLARVDRACTGVGVPYSACGAVGAPLPPASAGQYNTVNGTDGAQNPTSLTVGIDDAGGQIASLAVPLLDANSADVSEQWSGADIITWVGNRSGSSTVGTVKTSLASSATPFDIVLVLRRTGAASPWQVCENTSGFPPTLFDNGVNRFWTYTIGDFANCAAYSPGNSAILGVKNGAAFLSPSF